jgi:hypothetical protein
MYLFVVSNPVLMNLLAVLVLAITYREIFISNFTKDRIVKSHYESTNNGHLLRLSSLLTGTFIVLATA